MAVARSALANSALAGSALASIAVRLQRRVSPSLVVTLSLAFLVACVNTNAPPALPPSHTAHGLWPAEQSSPREVFQREIEASARPTAFGQRRLDRERGRLERQRSEERLRRELHIRDHDTRSVYGGR